MGDEENNVKRRKLQTQFVGKRKKKKEIVKLIFLHRSLNTGQRALQNTLGWLRVYAVCELK